MPDKPAASREAEAARALRPVIRLFTHRTARVLGRTVRASVLNKGGDILLSETAPCRCEPKHETRWLTSQTVTLTNGIAAVAEVSPCRDEPDPAVHQVQVMALSWLADAAAHEAQVQRQEFRRRVRQLHDYQLEIGAAKYLAEELQTMVPATNVVLATQVAKLYAQVTSAYMSMHNYAIGRFLPTTLVFRRTPIAPLLEHAERLCAPAAKRKGIQIQFEVEDATLEVAEEHMQQALNNVVHNAVKYSYHSASRATHPRFVSVRGRTRDGGYDIFVSNYGVGILEREYGLIFGEGYRGELTGNEYRGGAGMGLYLAKRIVEAHSGSIRVRSEPSQVSRDEDPSAPYQTRFAISLPTDHPFKSREVAFDV